MDLPLPSWVSVLYLNLTFHTTCKFSQMMAKRNFKLGTIVHIYNPSTKKTKAWRLYLLFLFFFFLYFLTKLPGMWTLECCTKLVCTPKFFQKKKVERWECCNLQQTDHFMVVVQKFLLILIRKWQKVVTFSLSVEQCETVLLKHIYLHVNSTHSARFSWGMETFSHCKKSVLKTLIFPSMKSYHRTKYYRYKYKPGITLPNCSQKNIRK